MTATRPASRFCSGRCGRVKSQVGPAAQRPVLACWSHVRAVVQRERLPTRVSGRAGVNSPVAQAMVQEDADRRCALVRRSVDSTLGRGKREGVSHEY